MHKIYINLLGVCVVDGLEDDWKLVSRGDELCCVVIAVG